MSRVVCDSHRIIQLNIFKIVYEIAVLGRTKPLLDTAKQLVRGGHIVKLVVTAKAAKDYEVDENDF